MEEKQFLPIETIMDLQIGTESYRKRDEFNKDELDGLRHTAIDKTFKIQDMIAKNKAENERFKREVKAENLELGKTMQSIKFGYMENSVDVFLVPDLDTMTVELYDQDTGEKLDVRKMRPDEKEKARQLTIHSITPLKKVADGN